MSSDDAVRPGRADPSAAPEPRIVQRPAQPYAAIRGEISMQTIPAIADRIPELIGRLAERGVAPAGPPFLKYDTFGPGDELVVEAGIPVNVSDQDEDPVRYDVLPSGRFALLTHQGHFDGLADATRDLLDWADEQDLTWDVSYADDREVWACRLEIYHTDPREEPDPDNWRTDLLIRLAD